MFLLPFLKTKCRISGWRWTGGGTTWLLILVYFRVNPATVAADGDLYKMFFGTIAINRGSRLWPCRWNRRCALHERFVLSFKDPDNGARGKP